MKIKNNFKNPKISIAIFFKNAIIIYVKRGR